MSAVPHDDVIEVPRATLDQILTRLDRIDRGLFGDEAVGHVGLVRVTADNTQRIAKLEGWQKWVLGGAAFCAGAYVVVKDFILRKT